MRGVGKGSRRVRGVFAGYAEIFLLCELSGLLCGLCEKLLTKICSMVNAQCSIVILNFHNSLIRTRN